MRRSRKPVQDQEGSLRAPAQHESDPRADTVPAEGGPGGVQHNPRNMQEEGEPEDSSLVSVRSRRSNPYRRPRQQQPEQALDITSAQDPVRAATPAREQAPATAGSHMPEHAHKRPRIGPVEARASAAADALPQGSAARPVHAFMTVGTPTRICTPEAAETSRDMGSRDAPSTQHDFHASGSHTPQLASQLHSAPLPTPDVGTPPMPAPQSARGEAQLQTTPAEPVPAGAQEPHQATVQPSTPMHTEPAVAMQLQGSGAPLSTETPAVFGSLESVWAARQATSSVSAASAPAQQHAPSPAPWLPAGSTPASPLPDHTTAAQSEGALRSDLPLVGPLRPKPIRTGLSPQPSAFRPVEQAAAAESAPAGNLLSFLAQAASQQASAEAAQQQEQQQQQQQQQQQLPHAPDPGQAQLSMSQVLAQQARSFSAGDSGAGDVQADVLQRFLLARQPGQAGQPDQAQPAGPEFGESLKRNYRSLSDQDPSSLIFKDRSQFLNPFAQLSSLPLRGKLPDLASLHKKPSRRRAGVPDLTEGGGDSDTVSVLSQHHSMKPEPEVTGPLEYTQAMTEAPDSEAARLRKVLGGALDFSGSSKPGLPTQLQSFSQEFAPKGTISSQDFARAAKSALLAGQSGSMGRASLPFRQSDVSAASYQIVDTILSQAHRDGGQIMSSDLGKLIAQPPTPVRAAAPPGHSPKAAPVASAAVQPQQVPVQALLQVSSATAPQVSLSADTWEGANPVGNPVDKSERRRANNRESARRTRAKKTNRLTELQEENRKLKEQLQEVQQQLGELRSLLQNLGPIGQHQKQLMEENENLKLEVQGLRSLMQGGLDPAAMAAAAQPPGSSQPPVGFQGGPSQP